MSVAISIFLFCYFIFATWCIYGTFRFLHLGRKSKQSDNTITLTDIALIIPFRNEANRIQPLLDQLKSNLPPSLSLIFVDDHSTDQSVSIIKDHLPHANILTSQGLGKKKALRTAIDSSERPCVLTWDADTTFSDGYFDALQVLEDIDLHILPVKFKGNIRQKFLQMDTELAQITNYAISGYDNPILASGANLLFKKEAYYCFYSTDNEHIPSGDDQFLLKAFKENGAKIKLSTDQALTIFTPCETSLQSYFHQRVRWFSKTPKVNDIAANKVAAIQFVLHFFWTSLVLTTIFQSDYRATWLIISGKLFLDICLSLRYFANRQEIYLLLLIPMYALFFPIYSLIIGIMSLTLSVNWKERQI